MIDIIIAYALGIITGIILLSLYCTVAITKENKKLDKKE